MPLEIASALAVVSLIFGLGNLSRVKRLEKAIGMALYLERNQGADRQDR